LPSATWAASHNNMVTFTAATLPGRAGCDRRRRVRCNDARSAHTDRPVTALKGLRDDVYRRPLATALDRLGVEGGWRCVDVGAGGGDVSVALAEVVGRDGRVYAVDSDPAARDEAAAAAAAHSQVLAITQAAEELLLPESVDSPSAGSCSSTSSTRRSWWPGWQERCARAAGSWCKSRSRQRGGSGAWPCRLPDARHPDIGALAPGLVRDAGLTVVDAWAEAPAGVARARSPPTSSR